MLQFLNTVTGAEENQIWASFIMLAVLLLASVLLGHLLRVASLSLTETLNKNCSPKIIDKLKTQSEIPNTAESLKNRSDKPQIRTASDIQLMKVLYI